jgi:hypothetical protein
MQPTQTDLFLYGLVFPLFCPFPVYASPAEGKCLILEDVRHEHTFLFCAIYEIAQKRNVGPSLTSKKELTSLEINSIKVRVSTPYPSTLKIAEIFS